MSEIDFALLSSLVALAWAGRSAFMAGHACETAEKAKAGAIKAIEVAEQINEGSLELRQGLQELRTFLEECIRANQKS